MLDVPVVSARKAGAGRNTRPILISALALMAGLGLHGQAQAQAKSDDFRTPPQQFIDALGIDMTSGDYVRSDTFLSIGDPSSGGLAWTYSGHNGIVSGPYRGHIGDASGLLDNQGNPVAGEDPSTYVWVGESAVTFEGQPDGSFVNANGNGATLQAVTGGYVYTGNDGTVYTFVGSPVAMLSTILQPNGILTTLNLLTGADCNSGASTSCYYVSAVTNTGYAFRFDASDSGHIYAINTVTHGCDAVLSNCTTVSDASMLAEAGTGDATMAGNGGRHMTDPMGKVWRYGLGKKYGYVDPVSNLVVRGPQALWSFKDPMGVYVSVSRAVRGGLTGFIDERGTFAYSGQSIYAAPGDSYTNTTRDPGGALMYTATFGGIPGSFGPYVDALSRTTTYNILNYAYGVDPGSGQGYGVYTRLVSKTNPEGDYVTYTYDARGNVTSAVKTGTAGSGLSVSFTASYPTTCTNLKTCNKPTWTKDAKGNQTDYTYDATHGGVLTVTLPADANAAPLRQRTYNTYTADTFGSNTLYRLTRTETCGLTAAQLSLTACPALATTSVATTTYLNHTFQPASVTQTDGAGSLSATTSYTYDVIGNVTMVDGPLSGTVDQTFKTYDAARRVIFEIGVDPDGPPDVTCPASGNGCLKRTMVKHTYDDAGREWKTETGSGNATDGSDFAAVSFKRMTYDTAGRLIKTEAVLP